MMLATCDKWSLTLGSQVKLASVIQASLFHPEKYAHAIKIVLFDFLSSINNVKYE